MVGPGSDNNGGLFDPSQTAGMFTDLAATSGTTSAPVVTSASYAFISADEGHWLYIALGTNWLWGWYQIVSTSGGAATLNGTLGAAYYKDEGGVSTAQGCASTGSPTGGTWSIDYSWNASARFAYTDLASVGTGLTISSSAKPFGAQMVGNGLQTTGGTNINLGVYVIASVASGVATLVGPTNVTTGAGLNGTGNQGGCFATPGMSWSIFVPGNITFAKYNATPNSISTTANAAGGRFNLGIGPSTGRACQFVGWDTTRTTANTDSNKTILQCGASSVTIVTTQSGMSGWVFHNIEFDGNSQTSSAAWIRASSGGQCIISRCRFRRFTGLVVSSTAFLQFRDCLFDANSGTNVLSIIGECLRCDFNANTCSAVWVKNAANAGNFMLRRCNFYGINSATVDYVDPGNTLSVSFSIENCHFQGNGTSSRHAINIAVATGQMGTIDNCVFQNFGAGWAITGSGLLTGAIVRNCAFRSNSSGNVNSAVIPVGKVTGSVLLTVDPVVDAAGGNFSSNATPGGGAVIRGAGIPGTFPAGTTPASSLDIGSSQHIEIPATILRPRRMSFQVNPIQHSRKFIMSGSAATPAPNIILRPKRILTPPPSVVQTKKTVLSPPPVAPAQILLSRPRRPVILGPTFVQKRSANISTTVIQPTPVIVRPRRLVLSPGTTVQHRQTILSTTLVQSAPVIIRPRRVNFAPTVFVQHRRTILSPPPVSQVTNILMKQRRIIQIAPSVVQRRKTLVNTIVNTTQAVLVVNKRKVM